MKVKYEKIRIFKNRYDKRVNLPYTYFYNRMNPSVDYNNMSSVTLLFSINEEEYEITRNLHTPRVEKVLHTKNGITNEIIGERIST